MTCRYCLEDDGPFVSPCRCKGTVGQVHIQCLNKWINIVDTDNIKCPICADIIQTSTAYEQYIFGRKNALANSLNTYYIYALLHTLLGILLIQDTATIPPLYIHIEVGTYIGHHLGVLYSLFKLKNKFLFAKNYLQQDPSTIIIHLIPPFIMFHVAFIENMHGLSYVWLVCISQMLYPQFIANIDSIIGKVNTEIEGTARRWVG
jgi:hypothetical protein